LVEFDDFFYWEFACPKLSQVAATAVTCIPGVVQESTGKKHGKQQACRPPWNVGHYYSPYIHATPNWRSTNIFHCFTAICSQA